MEEVRSGVNDMLEKLNMASTEPKDASQQPAVEELQVIQTVYKEAQQDHVLAFYDELSTEDKASLLSQLQTIDPRRINLLADEAIHLSKSPDDTPDRNIEPLPESATASLLGQDKAELRRWYHVGLGLIASNKVAVVLMAGGQGTRLGSSAPKGCFDIGLPSHKSLFQMQAERIRKLQQLAQKDTSQEHEPVVPWYIMTSGPTRKATEEFFHANKFFGLKKENVIVFEQGVLPCISNEGKILMETKSKVFDHASIWANPDSPVLGRCGSGR